MLMFCKNLSSPYSTLNPILFWNGPWFLICSFWEHTEDSQTERVRGSSHMMSSPSPLVSQNQKLATTPPPFVQNHNLLPSNLLN